MGHAQTVRDIVFWRWMFGLAVVPACLLAWSGTAVRPDEGFLNFALMFYPFCLLLVIVLSLLAMSAWHFAIDAWDFTLRLIGLRDDAPEEF